VVSVPNSCVSISGANCGVASKYVVLQILNQGTTTFSSTGTINVYISDVTTGSTATFTFASSAVSPGSTLQVSSGTSLGAGFSSGDTINIKVVMTDGGAATTSLKAIA